jgi:Rrf2 family protein
VRITQKTEYAVRALLDIAINSDSLIQLPIKAQDISRRQKIPAKYLETILVELQRNGLLRSRRGPDGGHFLTKPLEQITVGAVWRAMEGRLTSAPRAAEKAEFKDVPTAAAFEEVWRKIDEAVAKAADGISLQELRKKLDSLKSPQDFNI